MVLMALVGILSCDDDLQGPASSRGETATKATQATSMEEEPFYYYRAGPGKADYRIPLMLDPAEILVVASYSAQDLAQELSRLGILVQESRSDQRFGLFAKRISFSGATPENVREAVRTLRADPEISFVGETYRTQADTRFLLINRLSVRFRAGVGRGQISEFLASQELSVEREPPTGRSRQVYWLRYPEGANPLQVAAAVNDHELVDWATPDRLGSPRLQNHVPTDDYYSDQYYLKSSTTLGGVPVDINVEDAWHLTKGSSAVTIAVIGTGIEGSHPELSSQKATGTCSGGWDEAFASLAYSGDAWQPYGQYDGGADSLTYADEHETSVAGILVAQHDGNGTVGIAPNVKILSARVFMGTEFATVGELAEAIEWAWFECGADVVNGSFTWPSPDSGVTDAIRDGIEAGTVFVMAGGNGSDRDGSSMKPVAYPASVEGVIAVGAIDETGAVSNYSPGFSGGSCPVPPGGPYCVPGAENGPDLVAPAGYYTGVCNTAAVYTTGLEGSASNHGCNDLADGDYTKSFSGTSSTAPQVAAAAALVLSENSLYSPAQVAAALYEGADDWGSTADFGHGKLNVAAALDYDGGGEIESVLIIGDTLVKPNVQCTWWADVDGGTTPFTFEWFRNGSPVGDEQVESIGTGSSSFSLVVEVMDHLGDSMSDTLAVTVSGAAGPCVT